jgi:hypothetical protein
MAYEDDVQFQTDLARRAVSAYDAIDAGDIQSRAAALDQLKEKASTWRTESDTRAQSDWKLAHTLKLAADELDNFVQMELHAIEQQAPGQVQPNIPEAPEITQGDLPQPEAQAQPQPQAQAPAAPAKKADPYQVMKWNDWKQDPGTGAKTNAWARLLATREPTKRINLPVSPRGDEKLSLGGFLKDIELENFGRARGMTKQGAVDEWKGLESYVKAGTEADKYDRSKRMVAGMRAPEDVREWYFLQFTRPDNNPEKWLAKAKERLAAQHADWPPEKVEQEAWNRLQGYVAILHSAVWQRVDQKFENAKNRAKEGQERDRDKFGINNLVKKVVGEGDIQAREQFVMALRQGREAYDQARSSDDKAGMETAREKLESLGVNFTDPSTGEAFYDPVPPPAMRDLIQDAVDEYDADQAQSGGVKTEGGTVSSLKDIAQAVRDGSLAPEEGVRQALAIAPEIEEHFDGIRQRADMAINALNAAKRNAVDKNALAEIQKAIMSNPAKFNNELNQLIRFKNPVDRKGRPISDTPVNIDINSARGALELADWILYKTFDKQIANAERDKAKIIQHADMINDFNELRSIITRASGLKNQIKSEALKFKELGDNEGFARARAEIDQLRDQTKNQIVRSFDKINNHIMNMLLRYRGLGRWKPHYERQQEQDIWAHREARGKTGPEERPMGRQRLQQGGLPEDLEESVNKKVQIKGLLNEEAFLNGLTGKVQSRNGDEFVVALDENTLIEDKQIRLKKGEFLIEMYDTAGSASMYDSTDLDFEPVHRDEHEDHEMDGFGNDGDYPDGIEHGGDHVETFVLPDDEPTVEDLPSFDGGNHPPAADHDLPRHGDMADHHFLNGEEPEEDMHGVDLVELLTKEFNDGIGGGQGCGNCGSCEKCVPGEEPVTDSDVMPSSCEKCSQPHENCKCDEDLRGLIDVFADSVDLH